MIFYHPQADKHPFTVAPLVATWTAVQPHCSLLQSHTLHNFITVQLDDGSFSLGSYLYSTILIVLTPLVEILLKNRSRFQRFERFFGRLRSNRSNRSKTAQILARNNQTVQKCLNPCNNCSNLWRFFLKFYLESFLSMYSLLGTHHQPFKPLKTLILKQKSEHSRLKKNSSNRSILA